MATRGAGGAAPAVIDCEGAVMNELSVLASGVLPALRSLVNDYKIHPVLVNFTAALVPASVGVDFAARLFKSRSLRDTGWWTLFLAACITPLTALAGWLYWMDDDNGVTGMTIHKWLGTGLAILLPLLLWWRWRAFHRDAWVPWPYLIVGAVALAALVYQGHLGGAQAFGGM
jgi:uncharacterized membrane protein